MEKGLLHADAWKLFKDVGTENGGTGISGKLKKCAPARTRTFLPCALRAAHRTPPRRAAHCRRAALAPDPGRRELLAAAMRDRNHLILPDCVNDADKLEMMLQQLIDAGYELHAVCLWAPLSETAKRGEPRSVKEGKLWSGKDYRLSTEGVLKVARRFLDGMHSQPELYASVELWDNTIFPAEEVPPPQACARAPSSPPCGPPSRTPECAAPDWPRMRAR
eukprot:4702436-Prymnesium_polylepis.1